MDEHLERANALTQQTGQLGEELRTYIRANSVALDPSMDVTTAVGIVFEMLIGSIGRLVEIAMLEQRINAALIEHLSH